MVKAVINARHAQVAREGISEGRGGEEEEYQKPLYRYHHFEQDAKARQIRFDFASISFANFAL